MRLSIKALGCSLALAAAAGLVALHHARAQDGMPDASGSWTGKVSSRFFSMDGAVPDGHDNADATMTVSQQGNSLSIDLLVNGQGGPQEYYLNGTIGNGQVYASNGNGAFPSLVSCHLSGPDTALRMKGSGITGQAEGVAEFKFGFRRNPPPK